MPSLRVSRGQSTEDEFRFDGEVVIGRAEDCTIRVFDEAASRQHARIVQCDEDWMAEDLGSRNGLFVNGRRVTSHMLRTGDEIAVRGLTLVFLADGAADRPTVLTESPPLSIQSRVDVQSARVTGREEELLGRLAAVYRFAGALTGDATRRNSEIVVVLEEIFEPCRAAVVIGKESVGTHSRSVVRHVLQSGEAVLVREPSLELPRATSLVTEKVLSAIAAPLDRFGALYVDRTQGEAFTQADLEMLAALASAAVASVRPKDLVRGPQEYSKELVGESPVMRTLREEIAKVAPTDATVLVTGETGTGKELVARAMHSGGPRSSGPFVAVNCAAFVESLLEAELFGHEKGAFTGADRARAGRFEQADGGTIFLDEVGEIAPGLQGKLLRVLESREFHRIGSAKTTRVDVRIVAATNRDLRNSADFREDLYFRLGVVTLECPPLRARGSDITKLARKFLGEMELSDDAAGLLEKYAWPGNVRELKNVCERCTVLLATSRVEPEDLPLEVRLGTPAGESGAGVRTLKEMEREMVVRALEATGGNRTQAAKLLGITYPTLKKKIDEQVG